MLRVLCLMLLAAVSVAHASEVVELWNPPEARHAPHAPQKAQHRPAAHRLSAKRSMKTKSSRVAACVATPTKRAHAGRAVRINAETHVQNRPPVPVRERHVLRVDSNGARPEVVH